MKKLISTILLIVLSFAPIAAADNADGPGVKLKEPSIEVNMEAINEAVEQSTLLLQLKQKLAQTQYRYFILQNNIEIAKDGLVEIADAVDSLEKTIEILDELIKDTNRKIRSVKTQIERKKMEVSDIEEDVQILELQFEDQKDLVSELIALLYIKRGIYYDDEGVNTIKVLASPNSISQTFQKMTYIDLIEKENQMQIVKLEEMNNVLSEKWARLRQKRTELAKLDEELQGELLNLQAQREGKQNLLYETLGEQAIYESMLISAGDREEDILREIEIFEENVKIMESKLKSTRILLSDDQRDIIDQIELDAANDFSIEDAASFVNLDWAVSPKRGLTSYFIDEGYKKLFGIQHYAVDIRANHGSPIYAPADGVVYNVVFKEDSTRYAYIMIAHMKGVMTLYGHISEPLVKPGEYVSRGQIIGLTGATPGTVGAGVRTTGPHLHFEVWQDGIRVDPLNYLPLEEVPSDYLPEEYLEQMRAELEQQIRDIQEALLN